jgi:short subunit dehydrogenase-like uncharacterized protein
MPGVVLFGATGYTGRLTAHALARRDLDFKIVGRNRAKLERLSSATGGPEIAIAEVGDVDALSRALEGARVLVSCVGPFVELGDTAVEAALRAGCHYIDSSGEQDFIARLIDRHGDRARAEGIALAPALGFDEVPADVAISLACEGLESPHSVLTYAVPSAGSAGTVRSALGILTSHGSRVDEGRSVPVRAGESTRWAPMPPPLGVRLSTAFPFAIGRLAPLHIDFASLQTFVTTGRPQYLALRAARPLLTAASGMPWGRRLGDIALSRLPEGPGEAARRKPWTVLAEARSGQRWKNVVVMGRDLYGASAEFLAAGTEAFLEEHFEATGVVSPVQSVGLDRLQKEMIELSVTIETYESG